jgi:cell division protein ZapA (FtsZ GTPase activity inhibitor)
VVSKPLVSVRILGKEYSLRAGDNPERVREVAKYLDAQLREIAKANPSLPPLDVAVLGALNVVDEYFSVRDGVSQRSPVAEKDLEGIHERIRRIIDLIPG